MIPRELLKYFELYYFQYGIFPTQNEHIKAPVIKISLCWGCIRRRNSSRLYKIFPGTKPHELADIFIGGSKEQSKGVMTEFLKNLFL